MLKIILIQELESQACPERSEGSQPAIFIEFPQVAEIDFPQPMDAIKTDLLYDLNEP